MAVYIEIDSKCPETDERFAFLANKKFKVKTMKLGKFKVISQGLALPLSLFPELQDRNIGDDVTEALKITYASEEDTARKGVVNMTIQEYVLKACQSSNRKQKKITEESAAVLSEEIKKFNMDKLPILICNARDDVDSNSTEVDFNIDRPLTDEEIRQTLYYNRHDVIEVLRVLDYCWDDFEGQLDIWNSS